MTVSAKTTQRAVLVLIAGLVLSYQNCSQVGFNKDYDYLQSTSGTGLVIDEGRDVTNKKTVSVRFTGNTEVFTEMRLSTSPDFAGAEWKPFEASTQFDFDSEWAPAGAKDGAKRIYAELRASDLATPYPLDGSINLDTLAPTLEPKEILATGIQGRIFAKGQAVGLRWKLSDDVGESGYASGLAAKGLSIGIAQAADCGERVEWLKSGVAPAEELADFSWPAETPLDTFYICVIAQDRAGNATTLLSQPMTSLWRVYAGDNNQGNGGSVTAANVRFKYPSNLALDSKGNLFNADAHFRTIRKIASDDTRTITTYIGTGRVTGATEGNALDVVANPDGEAVFLDSQDRLYYLTGGYLLRATTNPMTGERTAKKIIQVCGNDSAAIRKVGDKESVVIHHACSMTPNDVASEAYIFEIPMSDLDQATAIITRSDLKAKYKIAGNGINPLASFVLPSSVVMSNNDSADLQFSVGYPGAMTVGAAGEIYFATLQDGSARGWGHHTVRKLTYLADGKVRVDLLTKSIAWANQLALMPAGTASNPALLAATSSSGLKKLELVPAGTTTNYAVSDALPTLNREGMYGVVRVGPDYYAAVSTQSRILHLDSKLNVIESLGRAVYRDQEPSAQQAMIGQPEGLVQDAQRNTYFFDSINHVVRVVKSTGEIELVAGQPGKAIQQYKVATPLANTSFDGLSVYNGGYVYNLEGSFTADGSVRKLYVGEGSIGRLTELDLNSKVANTISGANTQNRMNTPLFWPIAGVAKVPGSDQLYVTRYCPLNVCGTTPYKFTGLLGRVDVASTGTRQVDAQIAGDLTVDVPAFFQTSTNVIATGTTSDKSLYYGGLTAVRIDSSGTIFSSTNGFYMQKVVGGVVQPLVNIKINNSSRSNLPVFEMMEDGDDRLFFFKNGEGISVVRVNLTQAASANPPSFTSQKLCLPGTYVNEPRAFTTTKDGNLLIADSKSGRMLEYFLRDQDGKIKLSTCL